jgi:hypothetical protein
MLLAIIRKHPISRRNKAREPIVMTNRVKFSGSGIGTFFLGLMLLSISFALGHYWLHWPLEWDPDIPNYGTLGFLVLGLELLGFVITVAGSAVLIGGVIQKTFGK